MTRSRKRTPIQGNTLAESEQRDKHTAHRNKRRLVRQLVKTEQMDLASIVDVRDVSSTWSFAKDGRHWFDAKRHPQWLRK